MWGAFNAPTIRRSQSCKRSRLSVSISQNRSFRFTARLSPKNTFEAKAGLDVSPAVWHYLGMNDNEFTTWRFADAAEVPLGPWTEIVTTSDNNRVSSSKSA